MDDVLDLLLFKFNTDFSNGFSNTKYSCIVFASSIKARLHIPFTMRFLHCILCYVLELLALVITFVNGGCQLGLKPVRKLALSVIFNYFQWTGLEPHLRPSSPHTAVAATESLATKRRTLKGSSSSTQVIKIIESGLGWIP